MNDIEREIEGEVEEREESKNINNKINYRNDKKKKNILYILIGVTLVVLVLLVLYFVLNNNKDDGESNIEDKKEEKVDEDDIKKEEEDVFYVSCNDSTSLLNVRNAINGDIIDGLSCFEKVVVEEEIKKDDVCKTWYKISYEKEKKNYTGYVCGLYVKKDEVKEETYKLVDDLIIKALDYYDYNYLKAYCGNTEGTIKMIDFPSESNDAVVKGDYLKSKYKSLEELKEYLLSFLDKDLLTLKLELSDINNARFYDNYYEIDGNLYCRNYTGKGWLSYYTGNYNIEITSDTDNKITANVSYEYLNDDSKCVKDNLSSCPNSNFNYEIGKIVIEKRNDNYIITKMDFHK